MPVEFGRICAVSRRPLFFGFFFLGDDLKLVFTQRQNIVIVVVALKDVRLLQLLIEGAGCRAGNMNCETEMGNTGI